VEISERIRQQVAPAQEPNPADDEPLTLE
jgi:hypothetical protein